MSERRDQLLKLSRGIEVGRLGAVETAVKGASHGNIEGSFSASCQSYSVHSGEVKSHGVLRDGSVVKRAGCSCRRPELCSQQSHGGSSLLGTPVLGIQHLWLLLAPAHMCTYPPGHVHTLKYNKVETF